MLGSHMSEVALAPGSSTRVGPSTGPLTRMKVEPQDVSTVRVSAGTGQLAARAS